MSKFPALDGSLDNWEIGMLGVGIIGSLDNQEVEMMVVGITNND